MKKPTTIQEKVIIKPRPPKDTAQQGPVIVPPADTTAAPDVDPTEEMTEGTAAEEE